SKFPARSLDQARSLCLHIVLPLVRTAEQTIQVLSDEALLKHHGLGVSENQQQGNGERKLLRQNVVDEGVQQLDRCCFVAMNAGGNNQRFALGCFTRRQQFQNADSGATNANAIAQRARRLARCLPGMGQGVGEPVRMAVKQSSAHERAPGRSSVVYMMDQLNASSYQYNRERWLNA